jgi:putative iron-dependent peroxidase
VAGTLFFVPAADFLDDLPDAPGGVIPAAGAAPDVQSPPDDSLAIGDRKGSTA